MYMMSCTHKALHQDPIPKYVTFQLDSKEVNEIRTINIWTPPTYDTTSTDQYPVLYMADGGIKEDFPHIANTLSKLIEMESIPPIILVGIENTNRGRDLTGFSETTSDEVYCPLTDGAKNFRSFITKELCVEIEKKYNITNKRGLIGESLSGLFVMETFMLEPESFDFYIAMDPSLWWNDHYLTKNSKLLLDHFPNTETKLWFAGSSTKDISNYTNELAKVLETNAPSTVTWMYSNEPKEKHNTIFRATKEKALKWTLNN